MLFARTVFPPRVFPCSRQVRGLVFSLVLVLVLTGVGQAGQDYVLPIDVGSSASERTDKPVDAPVDLTAFLATVAGSLDPNTLQVTEVDSTGAAIDNSVLFQFDPVPDFDPVVRAQGNLVFVMAGDTPAGTIRHYRLLFDVVGGCAACPPAPVVPDPVSVDSLTYENQLTYLIETPRADYYYHTEGGGLASLVDTDGLDWIGFHDVDGSASAGEYRGLPNLVYTSGQPQNSYFHPGFTNSHSWIESAGPLKVTVISETDDPGDSWRVKWEFYPAYARLTVLQVGVANDGKYWFLYEGTVGGAMDAGDLVVRSTGAQGSAFDYADVWENVLPDPAWVYFQDPAAARLLFLTQDTGDGDPDSYRPQGQTSSSTPEMTVFGYGRVLNTSPDRLVPRMSGTGRTFTVGLMGDQGSPATGINGASRPLQVTVGTPHGGPSAVDGAEIPAAVLLHQNYPNPFNPRTRISFTLPAAARVRLDVIDLGGRKVAALVEGDLPAGTHEVFFDGRDLPSGMYISRLVTDRGSLERKMMLIR